ncbi:MAG: hypothetical protein M1816_007524 [Peltula sp. TS41687]|nr:MAG: hypothetical protein M1816_007524 [Peltula sp. TS41687]
MPSQQEREAQQRKEEILAKKARLAELKRRRDEISKGRPTMPPDFTSEVGPKPSMKLSAPDPERQKEIDNFISDVISKRNRQAAGSSETKESRPPSISSSRGGSEVTGAVGVADQSTSITSTTQLQQQQTLSTAPLSTVYEFAPAPAVKDVVTYSVGVQTSEPWSSSPDPRQRQGEEDLNGNAAEESPTRSKSTRSNKRLDRREREAEEALRAEIRREIEEELKALKVPLIDGHPDVSSATVNGRQNFPARALTDDELKAVTSSNDFVDFVDRSTKVIERALDTEYDFLVDYAQRSSAGAEEDEDDGDGTGRKGKSRLKEVAQFWDERWSKRRMITSIGYSPKFPELLLSSHTKNLAAPHDPDGVIQVWNLHLHDRPEYVFHAQSDVLVAKFSPYHPNLIIGGAYSGQVLLWDMRAKSAPVQRTPLTGAGHSHPVYAIEVVGTQNANNIMSCSTDGVVCGWTVDMLAQPQEYLELNMPLLPAKTDDVAPTCMAFPRSDPTYFLVGTEEGAIYPCHRYDRAGAKAGIDQRLSYRGHAAPVMSIDYHPGRGPIDLGDLVLSTSLDWSLKLWRVRPPASISTAAAPAGASPSAAGPVLDLTRDDVVYDAAWSPVKPGVFALVDGAGHLEVWDLANNAELPVARTQPGELHKGVPAKSLNRVVWEPHQGRKVAVGGLAGAVTVFDVGSELGGADSVRAEEWSAVRKLVARLEGQRRAA